MNRNDDSKAGTESKIETVEEEFDNFKNKIEKVEEEVDNCDVAQAISNDEGKIVGDNEIF